MAGLVAELAARGTIDPVVLGWLPTAGRGFGSGIFCARAGAAVRQINKDANDAAIASVRVCAV
jgi:hypothetical protein